ncbi:MAG: type I DNA topoisomerase, partial [Nitrospinales bacterium]
ACSGYPECKSTKQIETSSDENGKTTAAVETVDGECDKCGASLVVKMGRFGKFISCSKYPDCKFTKPMSLGMDCPEVGCEGYVTMRRSKKGRTFYGCSKYPKCKFTSWDKPLIEQCPQCKHPYLVEKWSKKNGKTIRCVKEGCDFQRTDEAA